MSAEILPFPPKRPQPDRLAAALARLDAALAEQRQAVGNWCAAIADLRAGMERLGASTELLQTRLGGLAADVGRLNREARRTVTLAERMGAGG
jgi:multidrug resistance efflux pump